MNATKTIYAAIPAIIQIPKEFVQKKGEIIILIDEELPRLKPGLLKDFFGILPDFPERAPQGDYEARENL